MDDLHADDPAGEDLSDKTGKVGREEDEYTTQATSKSRFRFKSSKRSRSKSPRRRHEEEGSHRRHHHRSKRRREHSPSHDDPSLYDDTHLPNASSGQYQQSEFKDAEAEFREHLFDAMADDEGAQFWEGVYGQPIHTYPDTFKEGPEGELERMTEDEYAAFVRAKMYEKTHQHLIEEKARRDAAKKERDRLAQEGRKAEREAEKFQRQVEESLKRGNERKQRKAWEQRWSSYLAKWDTLSKGGQTKIAIASIPWPVESGRRKDVDLKAIERFLLHAPTGGNPTETQLSKVLKQERVRWHPDKIQQKLGGQDVEESVIQAVTEVFQIIDDMWSGLKKA